MMYYVDKKEIVKNNNYYTFQLQELNVSFVDGDRPIFFRGWRQTYFFSWMETETFNFIFC